MTFDEALNLMERISLEEHGDLQYDTIECSNPAACVLMVYDFRRHRYLQFRSQWEYDNWHDGRRLLVSLIREYGKGA